MMKAHERGVPWDAKTTALAVAFGDLEGMKFAHEHGAPWHEETTAIAAEMGEVEFLSYAYEHGAPWDWRTTSGAAKNGHLECLRYAYFRGCPLKNEDQSSQYIREWNGAASTIARAWRRHRDAKRRLAVSVIGSAWLDHAYAPGGPGYARLAEAWRAKCNNA
jgi:hypothetical protein